MEMAFQRKGPARWTPEENAILIPMIAQGHCPEEIEPFLTINKRSAVGITCHVETLINQRRELKIPEDTICAEFNLTPEQIQGYIGFTAKIDEARNNKKKDRKVAPIAPAHIATEMMPPCGCACRVASELRIAEIVTGNLRADLLRMEMKIDQLLQSLIE